MTFLDVGVNPYLARPGVDLETECVGEAMRAAIWDLFESETYCHPDDIRRVFEELFVDIAIEHGWWQDADGVWFSPYVRGGFS